MGKVIDLEEYRRRRRERRPDRSGHAPEEPRDIDSRPAAQSLTPEQECDLLDSIFGTHLLRRACDCEPTLNCIHEPETDRGFPNPIYDPNAPEPAPRTSEPRCHVHLAPTATCPGGALRVVRDVTRDMEEGNR